MMCVCMLELDTYRLFTSFVGWSLSDSGLLQKKMESLLKDTSKLGGGIAMSPSTGRGR